MKNFKLIRSAASNAIDNMAQDENIYNQYLVDKVGVFRVYRWQGPSFTYGFSQEPQCQINLAKCRADGIGIAKRITGGGVLFHNDEIAYSFVGHKSEVEQLPGELVGYRNICKFLIRFYELLGLNPKFAIDAKNFSQRSEPSEFCSLANEKYDIVVGEKKIGGNAQKRKKEIIFQHGSIPCSVDWNFVSRYVSFLPNDIAGYVTTLSDELSLVPQKNILEEKLIEAFADTFGISFINYSHCQESKPLQRIFSS